MSVTAQQSIPDSVDLGQGADISGVRFGHLVAMRPVEKTQRGNRWLLRCDCGRFAIRLVAYLNSRGHSAACSECVWTIRAGKIVTASVWKKVYDAVGNLYSEDNVERCIALNRSENSKYLGHQLEEEEVPPLPIYIYGDGPSIEQRGPITLTEAAAKNMAADGLLRMQRLEFSTVQEVRRIRRTR